MFIKPDKLNESPVLFYKEFGTEFILFLKKDILEQKLLDTGKNDPRTDILDLCGDILTCKIFQ